MKYIKNYEEAPLFYSSYGSFMHKLIEQFYIGEITKEEMLTKFLFDFKKEVQCARLPAETTIQKYIQQGIDYLSTFKPLPFKPIGVEKRVKFNISGVPFVGFVDFLGERDGELYIVDNKSRDLKPRSTRKTPTLKDKELDEALKQLYIYSVAIKQEYGRFPKALCFNCFRTGAFIQEPFNEKAYAGTIKWAKERVEEIIEADGFPPNIDFFTCRYICGVNDRCCYYNAG